MASECTQGANARRDSQGMASPFQESKRRSSALGALPAGGAETVMGGVALV